VLLSFILLIALTNCEEKTSNSNSDSVFFTLSNEDNLTYKLTFKEKTLYPEHSEDTPVVLFNICSDSSPACIRQISSLSKLQEKYKKDLLILSYWTKDSNKHTKNILSQQKRANYFISNNAINTNDEHNHTMLTTVIHSLQLRTNTQLPLSIIYKEGNYYSYFEGSVPIEMIMHDIQQAIKE